MPEWTITKTKYPADAKLHLKNCNSDLIFESGPGKWGNGVLVTGTIDADHADIEFDKAQDEVCCVGWDLCLVVKTGQTTITFGNTDLIYDLAQIGVIIPDAPSTD
jgi:hypothetical protein